MKENKGYWWILLVVLLAWLVAACAAPRNIRQVEIPRNAALNNPQVRAGSIFLDVNPYTATWVVDRIYRGSLSRRQALGNVNGKLAFYNDYLVRVNLVNAIEYNLENPRDVPNVARVVLDPNTTYTVVRYVGWGRGPFKKDYAVEVFHIQTNRDAIRQGWTNKWGRTEYANVASVAAGSNQSSYDSLNLYFEINGTQLGRDAIGTVLEIGRR